MILIYVLVTLVSTAVVWIGSGILEKTSGKLADYYELPAIVQGAIIAAIGSSFPELSSTVLSTLLHGRFELGVAVIAGSAIFNILVIPGLSGLVSRGSLKSNRDLVYKEAQFYMVAVATLLLTFSFAVIYNPVGELKGEVNRFLALFPLMLYLLYIFIQYQDTMDYTPEEKFTGKLWKQWSFLLLSLSLILIGVEGLVRSAIFFGHYFQTPHFLWGLTVIAVATSISDSFISIRAAKQGRAVTSLANVLGSNTFDLLVAIPAGVLIAGSAIIDFAIAVPLMGFLVFATIVLFIFTRTDMELDRSESLLLLLFYVIFVFWVILESLGIVSFFL